MRVALVVLVVAVSARAAFAEDDLASAREREAALDYAGGLAIAQRALARGGLDPVRWVDLHVLAGRLAGGLDRAHDAEAHFARALAMRPELTLPDGTSPKITAPFAAAKARSVPLAIRVRSVAGLVTLEPGGDPHGLVVGIAVHVVDETGAHRDLVERRALRIALPAHTRATEAWALDVHGNRMWTGAVPAEVAGTTTPSKRSWLARWPTWAAVTGVGVAVGGFAAWRFRAAQDDWDRLRADDGQHDFSELDAVEDRGRRWGLTANIAFSAAALAGVATVVLYARGDGEPAIAVGASGSTIAVTGRF